MDNIGRKVVLWDSHYEREAYKDQFGIPHSGYIVDKEYVVTITEVREVKNMWSAGTNEGWKGVTEDGITFTCNWNIFPDDAMTPTYYWDTVNDHGRLWMPEDAEQVLSLGGLHPHMNRDGSPCIPELFTKCEKHNNYYNKLESCWRCDAKI